MRSSALSANTRPAGIGDDPWARAKCVFMLYDQTAGRVDAYFLGPFMAPGGGGGGLWSSSASSGWHIVQTSGRFVHGAVRV